MLSLHAYSQFFFLVLTLAFSSHGLQAAVVEGGTSTWKNSDYVVSQLSEKKIKVQSVDGKEVEIRFDLPIDNVYPNPEVPIALVTTYDEVAMGTSPEERAYLPLAFWTCQSFVVDLREGQKYPYEKTCSGAITNIWSPDGMYALNGFRARVVESSGLIELLVNKNVPQRQISGFNHGCGGVVDPESWHWITNDVVAFSGGACGTFLNYLFTVSSQKTEAYCSQFQKPSYGCPECSFLPASEFKWRLFELRGGTDYSELRSIIALRRKELEKKYLAAGTEKGKKRIVEESQMFLFEVLTDKVFPAWLGTAWSFNGTTRKPGEGSIACGTFVVYTLQDVGFKIPSKMARQPSENIIKNLRGVEGIKRFSNAAPMESVKDWIVASGEGIYIAGLDSHVGFIKYKNGKITFLHSNYYDPPLQVVDQDIMERSPLTDSNYRVFGKILDEKMVVQWLTRANVAVTYDYFGSSD